MPFIIVLRCRFKPIHWPRTGTGRLAEVVEACWGCYGYIIVDSEFLIYTKAIDQVYIWNKRMSRFGGRQGEDPIAVGVYMLNQCINFAFIICVLLKEIVRTTLQKNYSRWHETCPKNLSQLGWNTRSKFIGLSGSQGLHKNFLFEEFDEWRHMIAITEMI